eukprot:COSAG02_NODE_3858_length_6134_cov_6.287016_8_plen_81_part_00
MRSLIILAMYVGFSAAVAIPPPPVRLSPAATPATTHHTALPPAKPGGMCYGTCQMPRCSRPPEGGAGWRFGAPSALMMTT